MELRERTSFLRDQSILNTEEAVANVRYVVDRTDTQMTAVIEDLKTSAKAQEQTQSMMNDINDLEEIRKDARRAVSIALEHSIKTAKCKLYQGEIRKAAKTKQGWRKRIETYAESKSNSRF